MTPNVIKCFDYSDSTLWLVTPMELPAELAIMVPVGHVPIPHRYPYAQMNA